MRTSHTPLAILSLLLATATVVEAQPQQDEKDAKAEAILKSIDWQKGPTTADIGTNAEMQIPEGYVFTGPTGTRKMLELMENPSNGRELGFLTPVTMQWFLIFEFSGIGYVKDADKEELDGGEILDSIKEGTEHNNAERRKRGWPEIKIIGWQTAPFYDKESKNLKWCIKGESEGKTIINFNTRILGRKGVMSANLLVAPDKLDETLPELKKLITGFKFKEGHRYSEYKKGDRIAEYGLTALIVGGGAAAAAKLGLFAKLFAYLGKLWKLLLVGLLAIGGGIKALFTGRRRGAPPRDDDQEEVGDEPRSSID